MAKKKGARLVVRRGKKTDLEIPLEKQRIRIGTRADCDVLVDGDYASDIHATVEQRDGQWVLENLSPHGTYVNRDPVARHTLRDTDRIQIGAENLFEFAAPEQQKTKGEGEEGASGLTRLLRLDNPAVVVGVVAYALLLIVGWMFLGQIRSSPPSGMHKALVEKALGATTQYLSSDAVANGETPPPLPARTDPAYGYYELVRVATEGGNEEERTALAEKLTDRAREHLTRAWHFENQHRWKDASAEYSAIIDEFPNRQVPVTRLALKRRGYMRKKIADESED